MAKFFINRPIVAIVIAILTVIAGVLAMNKLPIAQLPDIVPPQVTVSAVYTGADMARLSEAAQAGSTIGMTQLPGLRSPAFYALATDNNTEGDTPSDSDSDWDTDGVGVGCARAVQVDSWLGLFSFATRPAARRRGHAAQLLGALSRWGAGHGATRAWLQVESGNHAAASLYRRCGFHTVYSYAYARPADC